MAGKMGEDAPSDDESKKRKANMTRMVIMPQALMLRGFTGIPTPYPIYRKDNNIRLEGIARISNGYNLHSQQFYSPHAYIGCRSTL